MARPAKTASAKNIRELQRMNKKLKAENAELRKKVALSAIGKSTKDSWFSRSWRGLAIFILVALAGALLFAGNTLFWAGRSLVDSAKYEQTTAPLIKDPEIQKAVAIYTTKQIFQNIDVVGFTQSVLPQRADFLAAPLSERIQSYTQTAINKTLANQKFQDTWNKANLKAHDSLLALANSPQGQDGVINLNEIYQKLSDTLKDTKLSFLAGKQLPAKVGQITVLKSNKLHTLHVISANINTLKYVTLGLVALFSAIAIWLSKNRRRLVISLGLLYSILMLLTALSLRVVSTAAAQKVQPDYQTAVAHVAAIIFHPFVIQSATVFLISLLIAFGAWVSGPYRPAKVFRLRVNQLLEGKIHSAIFPNENGLTRWVASHKRSLRLTCLVLIVLIMLLVQLSPGLVLLYTLVFILLLAVIEILAANSPKTRPASRPK